MIMRGGSAAIDTFRELEKKWESGTAQKIQCFRSGLTGTVPAHFEHRSSNLCWSFWSSGLATHQAAPREAAQTGSQGQDQPVMHQHSTWTASWGRATPLH